jgi:hypothetical protein
MRLGIPRLPIRANCTSNPADSEESTSLKISYM